MGEVNWRTLQERTLQEEKTIQGVNGTVPSGLSGLPRGQSRKMWSTP